MSTGHHHPAVPAIAMTVAAILTVVFLIAWAFN